MKTASLRNPVLEYPKKYIKPTKRQQLLITLGMPDKRLREIESYIHNSERGRLHIINDGADVTRSITAEQIAKFLSCKDCQAKPVIYMQCKPIKGVKRCVGMCSGHWIGLADTVIGWNGE
jgi:hypothetical protein